ncbi:MAG: copper amine oxidase N-terminal domain-containing protein, partial [Caldiserica bacterium]|nr:copper amine oxidase N-terminal domain-containing protein [Caldisericota bacterium]
VELWIGKSAAKVNGVSTLIDPANANVVPEIINGRTMLPVRFVSENLGCSVLWADATRTITITYEP